MNKLTIFSDTRFFLSMEAPLVESHHSKIEDKIRAWIANEGLLILPFPCEIEDLRDTSKLFAVDITGGNRVRYPYELGTKD